MSDAIEYAKHYSRAHDAVIRVYDEAGNVIETQDPLDGRPPKRPEPGSASIVRLF